MLVQYSLVAFDVLVQYSLVVFDVLVQFLELLGLKDEVCGEEDGGEQRRVDAPLHQRLSLEAQV